MKLFVGNLPFSITEQKLKDLFEKFGEIKSFKLITDRETGKSRGFAFVEFTNKESGNKAIKEFNGSTIEGRSIVVKIANARPTHRYKH